MLRPTAEDHLPTSSDQGSLVSRWDLVELRAYVRLYKLVVAKILCIHGYHVTSLRLSAAIFVSESLAERRSQHRQ